MDPNLVTINAVIYRLCMSLQSTAMFSVAASSEGLTLLSPVGVY